MELKIIRRMFKQLIVINEILIIEMVEATLPFIVLNIEMNEADEWNSPSKCANRSNFPHKSTGWLRKLHKSCESEISFPTIYKKTTITEWRQERNALLFFNWTTRQQKNCDDILCRVLNNKTFHRGN